MRGFGADAMIEIDFESDEAEIAKSVDGENRHVFIEDLSGTITVTLSAQSATNAWFSAARATKVPIPMNLVDGSSNGDLFFAGSCVCRKRPPMIKGKSNAENVWIWQFTKGRMNHGGAVA